MKKTLFLAMMLFAFNILNAQILINEDFETGNIDGETPTGWICEDGGWLCNEGDKTYNRKAHSGSWYVTAQYNDNTWMYKEMNVTEGQLYRVSFWHLTNGNDHFTFEIKAGEMPYSGAMGYPILPPMEISNTEYENTAAVFNAPITGTIYIGFHSTATYSPWYLCIDDIIIEQTESYNFRTENLTPDSILYMGETGTFRFSILNNGVLSETVSLTNEPNILQPQFYIGNQQVSSVTLDPDATAYVNVVVTMPTEGVLHNENILLQIIASSTNTGHTENIEFNVTAKAPYFEYPLTEGFEDESFPPEGWRAIILDGSYNFIRATSGEQPTCVPHDGSNAMAMYKSFYAHAGQGAILVSPKLSTNSTDNIVRFWIYRTNNIYYRADKINVYFNDTPDLESASLLGSVHRVISMEPIEDHDDWFEYSYSFDSEYDNGYIIFEAYSDYGWNMYLDDIFISNSSSDDNPPEVISLSGNHTYADVDMNLVLCARDASDMPEELTATYNINGTAYNLAFVSSKNNRGDHYYTATIPAQPNHTSGTMTVNLVDINGNSAVSDPMDLSWDWQAPLLEEGFEGETFPPEGWTREGMPLTWMQWSRWGTVIYDDSDENEFIVTPPEGTKQACLEWDFQENPQDEHLITPLIPITRPTELQFETFAQLGTIYYDHFEVRVFNSNDYSCTVLWDAYYLPEGINMYEETVHIDLSQFIGSSIKIDWRGYNSLGTNLWYSWFIDNVKVIPTDTIQSGTPVLNLASLTADTTVNMNSDAALRFMVSNTGDGNDQIVFAQTESEISGTFFIDGTPTNTINLPAGQTKEGYLLVAIPAEGFDNQQTLSFTVSATSQITQDVKNVNFNVTVINPAFLLGDANGDGAVDISDITTVIYYIFNGSAPQFIFENADANHDGIINVTDVMAIITIILENKS